MNRVLRPDRLTEPPAQGRRKPRILIAGEFSAGKTRLITGLLGADILPSNVTSTALPPIWLIGGHDLRMAVQPDGGTREVSTITEFDLSDTRYGVLAHPAPVLEQVDIIDTPGNSDPNIPPETWQVMVDYADAVIWCSNATQAWRQSEKSVWQEMPMALRRTSTLLLTHADRLPDQRATDRVLRRVQREAAPFFAHMMVASLLSETDLARIGQHVQGLARGLASLPGADNAIVQKATEAARRTIPVQPTSPRRVRPAAEPVSAQSSATTAPVTMKPAASAQAHAINGGDRKGPVRRLWEHIGGGSQNDDVATLLARIDRLITLLDEPPKSRPTTLRPDRAHAPVSSRRTP
ncbi:hypothetical protein [Sagittula sp. S175]|uniref:hypothetical protein n=1 Tax=Sagittula sp. S175 TaxID=3415129 RepID=UPI003C7D7D4D